MTWVSRLPEISAGMVPKAEAAVTATVAMIEASAKGQAPVDTGNLRNSIQGQSGGLEGRVNCGASYGIYQEFGTYKMAAQPFMVPAAEAARGPFMAAVAEIVS